MLLSLLVPTLESRRSQFEALRAELNRQIREGSWGSQVEILGLADRGENAIGSKRNELVSRAQGLFLAFVDDDDQVSGDYISRICRAIQENSGVDCIGIRGEIQFRGGRPRPLIHSIRYRDYFSRNHTYYRPPYHLNPIRREIAARYPFANVSYSEDVDYALRMRDDRALQSEIFVDSVLYYYRCRRLWVYQWLLDLTEPFRHKYGIRFSNRLRMKNPIQTAERPSGNERNFRGQWRFITG